MLGSDVEERMAGRGAADGHAPDPALLDRPIPMTPQSRALLRVSAAVAALALAGCSYTAPDPTPTESIPTAAASIDNQARQFIANGAVAAVVRVRWPGGEWSKAYGVRDLDTKKAAQPDDRLGVASVTKTMTAVTALKLVDDRLIGLDDPVNDVIPGFTTSLHPPGPITVRQLLNHTSGIPEVNDALPQDPDFRPVLAQEMTMERELQLAGTLPWTAFSVGEFHYSNTNYAALGLLVQTLRHRPFAEVLRDEVIVPLGLSKTSTDRVDIHAADLLHGYVTLHGERIDLTDNSYNAGLPDSGAVSTMGDLNTFFAALFQGRLVSAASLAEMKKAPLSRLPYGLGVWMHSDGCSSGQRYEGRGGFWEYRTVAVVSDDGKYQAAMSLSVKPMATELEDSDTSKQRDLYSDQVESAVNDALDRLCQQ
ncbi:serine hydrolase domain-containing protein [Sinomonas sp. ASV486]|uniref:serine hydrolase domain-containing protein n=1 Tax=Sinomonas sp. ASV486 TaxID=3051170 RepID=UPI0027DDC6B0|nr:serine hydrolase domain-containing protein [Sinomonas sp. ASV486]MDQ4490031.1 serine hydrolase domain-containing protein [Sinomonas sp. ASV486]